MATRISPNWKMDMQKQLKYEYFTPVVLSFNMAAQWLIKEITISGRIAKVENLGAGVKRISIIGNCCPTCGKTT